jgi:hypothetical protein
MVFACTGFFIQWNGSTAILTSASLVSNPCDESNIDENLTVGASRWSMISILLRYCYKSHCIICRLKYVFQTNCTEKGA